MVLLALATVLAIIRALDLLPPPQRAGEKGPEEKVRVITLLLINLAAIVAAVALFFNRFKGQTSSDKYPAIVQDTVVIACFALAAAFWWSDYFLTTSAVGAVIVGFALQDTLGNLFAGLAIQIEKPFNVGDWIRVADMEGLVLEVTWRATKIRTKPGNFLIVPNSLLSKDKILNYSQPTRLTRLQCEIGLGYEVPPNKVKEIALDCAAEIPEILKEPAPDVLLIQYGEWSIQYRCRFWIEDYAASEPITDQFTTLIYYRLKRADLSLPFPIRDIRITERSEAPRLEAVPDRLDFVDKVDLFSGLDPTDKARIADAMRRITFGSAERIIQQGTPGDSMFFIRSGSVRIVLDGGGESHDVAVLAGGQYFGEMALLTGEPRKASAIARGDVDAYVLQKDKFREVLSHDPTMATRISEIMAERSRHLDETRAHIAEQHPSGNEDQKNLLSRIKNFFGL